MAVFCTDCDVAAVTISYKIVLAVLTTTGSACNNHTFRLNIMVIETCIVSVRVSVYVLSFGIKILLYINCTDYVCPFNIDVVSCVTMYAYVCAVNEMIL